ncbi:MAG: RNA 2',3'-cyclic phosphodiesterase [Planctomycetales bacterium]|nr:RNA 2',3'-cyclic phosphodiesterase [Planctomycetales bacterium]
MPTRTFLAVDCAEFLEATVSQLIRRLDAPSGSDPGPAVKWVRPENLHLTLKFFGDIDDEDIVAISRAVPKALVDRDPFPVRLAGVGAFPDVQRARTLWIGFQSGSEELIALQEAIDEQLADIGFRPERRRFHPHLTIGRLRDGRNRDALVRRIEQEQDFSAEPFFVEELVLVASHLKPKGPTYTVLSSFEL